MDVSAMTLEEAGGLALVAFFIAAFNWLSNRGTKQDVKKAKETAVDVKTTLTENNGGSSVKDYLDILVREQRRQMRMLERINKRQDQMTVRQDRQEAKTDAFDKKLNAHISKSNEIIDEFKSKES